MTAYADASIDGEHRHGQVSSSDRPVDRRPPLAKQDCRVIHAQERLTGPALVRVCHRFAPFPTAAHSEQSCGEHFALLAAPGVENCGDCQAAEREIGTLACMPGPQDQLDAFWLL